MTRQTHYQDTREHLLDVGERVMRGRGFAATGLSEILNEAEVPKGSFYHYFKSKEAFGVALLERYFARYLEELDAFLGSSGEPEERLLAYFSQWIERMQAVGCSQGCFAVKLSAEVSDLSEDMRLALVAGRVAVVKRLAVTLRQIQEPHADHSGADVETLAESLYALWCGADLASKVQRGDSPLQAALMLTRRVLNRN
ncbi:MAG: TetR/AcrR family transcriptional regulator [Pseudomonadales bacterium]|nr:TetR/AcrR family transcriptional regulator [Pseudomonadales bacterium]